MATPGTGVIKFQGTYGIRQSGIGSIFSADGKCDECCYQSPGPIPEPGCMKEFDDRWLYDDPVGDNGPWDSGFARGIFNVGVRRFQVEPTNRFVTVRINGQQNLYSGGRSAVWAPDPACTTKTIRWIWNLNHSGIQTPDPSFLRQRFYLGEASGPTTAYCECIWNEDSEVAGRDKLYIKMPNGWYSQDVEGTSWILLDTLVNSDLRFEYVCERHSNGNITWTFERNSSQLMGETNVTPISGPDATHQSFRYFCQAQLNDPWPLLAAQDEILLEMWNIRMEYYNGTIGQLPPPPF